MVTLGMLFQQNSSIPALLLFSLWALYNLPHFFSMHLPQDVKMLVINPPLEGLFLVVYSRCWVLSCYRQEDRAEVCIVCIVCHGHDVL